MYDKLSECTGFDVELNLQEKNHTMFVIDFIAETIMYIKEGITETIPKKLRYTNYSE